MTDINVHMEIVEKPDWITWEDIHACIHKAHAANVSKGMEMKTLQYSAQELEERLGRYAIKSKVFVALDGTRLVGVAAVTLEKKNRWCYSGDVAHLHFAAVDPEYRGMNIYGKLSQLRYDFAYENNCVAVEFFTAEDNRRVQEINVGQGFQYVDFIAPSDSFLYYVLMAKIISGNKPSALHVRMRFFLKKLKTKLLYKPGHIRRLPSLK